MLELMNEFVTVFVTVNTINNKNNISNIARRNAIE